MAMNLTDSGSNMHSEEQQNPEQVAKFNITFRLYASTMKRKAYAILRDEGWAEDAVQWKTIRGERNELHTTDEAAATFEPDW